MKKLFTLMIAVAAMISFTACEKDGNEPELPNEIVIGTKTYPLGGAVSYFYASEKLYNLWFADKVYWDKNGDWTEDDSKYANGIEVNVYELFADGITKGSLPTGRFIYSDSFANMTHSGYSDYMLYNETGNGEGWSEFGQENVQESKLVIEIKHIKGNIYEIIFTGGVDENGNAVNGYYKGAVDIFEYDSIPLP